MLGCSLSIASLFSNASTSILPDPDCKYVYDLYSDGQFDGTVEKNWWGIRTHYTVSNKWSPFVTGTTRLICWGSVNNKWKELDVYDYDSNRFLGAITGINGDGAHARFGFYDPKGQLIAIAHFDRDTSAFAITHPENTSCVYVSFRGATTDEGVIHWTYTLENSWFSYQLMHVFGAFMQDVFPPTTVWTNEEGTELVDTPVNYPPVSESEWDPNDRAR